MKAAKITPIRLLYYCPDVFRALKHSLYVSSFIGEVMRSFHFVFACMDDFLISSPTPRTHGQHLRQLFSRLRAHNLAIDPHRCVFGGRELDLLRHSITSQGIRRLDNKMQLVSFPLPTCLRKLSTVLGRVIFYRRILPRCVHM